MSKIINSNFIKKNFFRNRFKKKKIVLCHGVYDLFHFGHLKHLEYAKSKGDILIVSVTADEHVNKGFGKPIFKDQIRAELISKLIFVDYVIISNQKNAVQIIHEIKPNYYCKGIEYKDKKKDITKQIYEEEKELRKYGGKIIYSNEIVYSSSQLLNENFNIFNKKQKNFISILKKDLKTNKINKVLSKINFLKTMVIGEIITDEYIFADAIGKSGKEPVLIMKPNKTEKYFGGAASIVKIIDNFSNKKNYKTTLLSYIGSDKKILNSLKKYLGNKINLKLIYKKNSPTINKIRFLDSVNNTKIFGLYNYNDEKLDEKEEANLIKKYKSEVKKNHTILVCDYGHGLISNKVAKIISKNHKNIFLNAQINASNVGYQNIQKYNNIKCLIINEKELRYELRDSENNVKYLIKKIFDRRKYKTVLVTRGSDGILYFDGKNRFYECPAFADSVLDRVGAGDVLLSFFAPLMSNNVNIYLALFISSIAASIKLKNFANKEIISLQDVVKHAEHLLK